MPRDTANYGERAPAPEDHQPQHRDLDYLSQSDWTNNHAIESFIKQLHGLDPDLARELAQADHPNHHDSDRPSWYQDVDRQETITNAYRQATHDLPDPQRDHVTATLTRALSFHADRNTNGFNDSDLPPTRFLDHSAIDLTPTGPSPKPPGSSFP